MTSIGIPVKLSLMNEYFIIVYFPSPPLLAFGMQLLHQNGKKKEEKKR
jgi:hypothetical protein